ncbi:transcription factor WhiB [Streptomyces sp. MI02-7b]|uniref:transcription factor WhiB n=1 Tax=Streptomyces sp. MI02-7b TaxID=462941 RepID=UPI0029B528A6|nr:transcription factor WhiB [Streptomyces sp. MI02-7b]MDX3074591.1 transcription factor WhiB [Streptomyces sp. MI02-7b]
MTGPWIGGLTVRRTDHGQTPIADHLCTRCGHHTRVTGRQRVTDYIRSNPIADHRAACPALKKGTTA